jgi:hypothetical protein
MKSFANCPDIQYAIIRACSTHDSPELLVLAYADEKSLRSLIAEPSIIALGFGSRSAAPGGKVINPGAFTTPVPATAQGDLGRNALRGFGATQWDITLRRQFRFTERLSLQARGDFFNILNHPNFGSPINYISSPQFGQATMMLNNSLGSGGQSGGLNPLYQIGGPRSIQLALKLQF